AACDVLGVPVQVRFAIDPELFQAARRAEAAAREPAAPPVPKPASTEEPRPTPPPARAVQRARRWHRLGDFVVRPGNRVAHAAAQGIVESPGQDANPLVLHGPVGTGKTHLLEGIYLGFRKSWPEWRLCFVTAEEFTNRFVQAMHAGKLGGFRKHFRE